MRLTRVWPLRAGIRGWLPDGTPTTLEAGVRGLMDYEDAVKAELRGEVDIMAGKDPHELRSPDYETSAATSQAPEDPDSVPDEDEPPPAKPPRRRAGKKTYARRDVQAEKI